MKKKLKVASSMLALGAGLSWYQSAPAASTVIWNGTTDGLWLSTTNWSSATPPTSGDTALFNNAGNGNTTITVDTGRTVKVINFDTGTVSYTIGSLGANGGNALTLNSAATIALLSSASGTNLTETINAPLTLSGAASFTNARADAGSSLVIAGNITNNVASALTLNGAGTGANVISGNISDGTGATSVTVSTSAGSWALNGANAYTGTTTINNASAVLILGGTNSSSNSTVLTTGTLRLTNTAALSNSIFTLTAGTLQLRSDTNNDTFSAVSTAIASSATINVDQLTGAGSNNTLKFGAINDNSTTTGTITVTAGNGYGLGLGAVTQNNVGGTTLTFAVSAPLTIASFNTISNSASSKLSFTGMGNETIAGNVTMSGTGTLSLDRSGAAGTLILQGTSNMTGGVVISNGTIQTSVATNAFGNTSAISISAAGTLALRGNSSVTFSNGTTAYPITVATSGATINVDQATSAVAGTALSLGSVTMNGALTLNTTGSNGVGLTLGAVTSNSVAAAALGFTNNIAAGGKLTLASVAYTASTAAQTITFNGSGATVVTGTISQNTGTAAVTYSGSGSLTLNGTSAYTGATNVSSGRLNVIGSIGGTAMTVSGGATLAGTGFIGSGLTAAGGTVSVAGGTTAPTRGTIDLVDGALGTLTIRGNTTPAAFLTLGGTGTSNSILNFETGAAGVDKIAIANSGTLLVNAGGATINLTALPSTTLANGTYDLMSYASATYTGALTLTTTEVGSKRYLLNNSGTAEQLIVTAAAGTTAYWTGSQSTTWDTISPTTNFTSDAAGTTATGLPVSSTNVFFTANSATNLTATLGQNDFTINSLTLTGTGTSGTSVVTIGGTRTLTINGGGLTVQSGAGADVISSKIALGASQAWQDNSAAIVTIGAIDLGANTLTLNGVSGSRYTINSNITGTGALIINTTGTVAFGPNSGNGPVNNSFTGGITLNAGTLTLGGGGNGNSTANVAGLGVLTINGGSIDAGGNISNNALALSGQVWNADWTYVSGKQTRMGTGAVSLGTTAGTSRTVTISNATGTVEIGGAISDGTTANSLTKAGSGTLRLTGSNLYTGATNVNAGNLILNGSISSAGTVTVATTATLNGTGTIAGSALIQSGGTLAPGALATASVGIVNTGGLTVPGTLTFDVSKAVARVGVQPLVGTDYDQVNVTGAVDVSGGNLALTLTSGLEAGDILYVVKNDLTDATTGTFSKLNGVTTNLSEGSFFTTGYASFQITYLANAEGSSFNGGNDIALDVTAVPEPASLSVLALGATGLLARRRRKSSAAQ